MKRERIQAIIAVVAIVIAVVSLYIANRAVSDVQGEVHQRAHATCAASRASHKQLDDMLGVLVALDKRTHDGVESATTVQLAEGWRKVFGETPLCNN